MIAPRNRNLPAPTAPDLPPRMRPAEAMAFLGCSPNQLKRLRARRAIRFYAITGRSVSYDTESLKAFLAAREVPTIGGAT